MPLGQVPWNKGKTGKQYGKGQKRSQETCLRIHLAKLGSKNHNWKGGRTIHNGYVFIRIYENSKPKCIREHFLVIEKYFGRRPRYPEVSHHVNENKTDNQIQNLMLFKNQFVHQRFHKLGDVGVKCEEIIFDGRYVPYGSFPCGKQHV